MKKWIFIFAVLGVGAWALYRFSINTPGDSTESESEEVSDEVSAEAPFVDDRVKVSADALGGLSADLLADAAVQEIIANAHGDFQDFVAKNEARLESMLPAAAKLIVAIRDCDSKDHCGEQVRDQTRTQHQQLLAGALSFVAEAYRVLGKRQDLSSEALASLFAVNNNEVQSLAADVIAYSSDGVGSLKAALPNWKHLGDDAVSTVAQSTDSLSREDSSLRSAWIDALSQWLQEPSHNPEPFYSNLSLLDLNESEFQKLARALCRFAGNADKKEVYAVLRFKLATYAQSQGWGGFSEESCSK
jgi:hypothetical protein